jgi:uncharacterized membrane protein
MLSAKCYARIATFLLFCAVCVFPAFAREWRIANFSTHMTVARDGSAEVTERLEVVFEGEYHGIYRDIPIEYPGPHGSNYTLFLHVTGVTDDAGNKLKYDSSVNNGSRHLKIYVPGAVDTTRTVLIHYTVRNPIRWFDDYDELYWNVTGNDWPVPIERASASIEFPSNAAGNMRAQAFTGFYGSTGQDAQVSISGNTVGVVSSERLSMHEGLTTDVALNKGVLAQPSSLTKALWFLRSNAIVLLPLWALVVMFWLWWKKGRDPKPDSSVAPMYEPPKDMTPAECGSLLDDAVNPRDISATLVDLAVKNYIKIEETESKVLLFTHRDYTFHQVKDPSTWAGLQAHERVMMNHMFQDGATDVRLSDLKNKFYTAIPSIKENVLSLLKSKGMYSVDPDSAHAYVFLGILLAVAPFILAQVLGIASILESPGLLTASATVAVIVIIIFARIMTAKSKKGVQTKIEILGFQEFVNRVDADRLRRMPSDTFEKFLPYAMALGIENRWAKNFEGIVQNPPTWYVGPTAYSVFNPIFFATSMHAMASDVNQTFVSAPRSSSGGSGFGGGGGFSGGGFGGGGGGAF